AIVVKTLFTIIIGLSCFNTSGQTMQCKESLHYKQEQFYEQHPELQLTNTYDMKEVLDRVRKTAINQKSFIAKDSADERRLDSFLVQVSSDTSKGQKYEDPVALWLLTYMKGYLEKTLQNVPAYKNKVICLGTLPSTEPNAYTE